MAEIYLPTLHTFAMDNIFTGSWGQLRFRIVPHVVKRADNSKEVDMAESRIEAQFWHGEKCYELSTVEGERTFPMSEEGRRLLKDWLEAQV